MGLVGSASRAQIIRAALTRRREPNAGTLSPAQKTILRAYQQLDVEHLVSFSQLINEASLTARQAATTSPSLSATLVKPVGDHCNLRCSYCYEGAEDRRKLGAVMSDDLLIRVIEQVIDTSGPVVEFVWHGGEPLLAGLAFFQRVIDLQGRLNRHGKRIRNSVQTNGTLLDDAWMGFFARFGFKVGLSLDSPADLHDRLRVDARGRGTFAQVRQALDLLRTHGIPHGAILVAGEAQVGRHAAILQEMHALRVESFDIHPSCGNGVSNAYDISPSDFANLSCALFDQWLLQEPYVEILTFSDVLRFLAGQKPKTCYFAGRCSSIVAVEANGDVVPCTRPFEAGWTFGNIGKSSLAAIIMGARFQDFMRCDIAAQTQNANCRWFGMCHNGCPQHRRNQMGAQIDGKGIFCDCSAAEPVGWPALFDHIERRVMTELAA